MKGFRELPVLFLCTSLTQNFLNKKKTNKKEISWTKKGRFPYHL